VWGGQDLATRSARRVLERWRAMRRRLRYAAARTREKPPRVSTPPTLPLACSQAMLNRFVAAKSAANRDDKSQRPYLASECDDLQDCERYRNQIIKEISKKVSLIQNEGLDEHKVRDLNDAINKLMREKGHWERQIKSLGGPDYFRTAPKLMDDDAAEVVPGKGYRYYGAAKKLPGVKELFAKAAPERQKRTRHEMMKGIDADYYGYRDDDDGILQPLEKAAEAERLVELRSACQVEQSRRRAEDPDGVAAEERDLEGLFDGSAGGEFVSHVVVPDQDAIKQAILARRKQELLARLASSAAGEVGCAPESHFWPRGHAHCTCLATSVDSNLCASLASQEIPEQGPQVRDLGSLMRLPPSW
jgi:pre-mRNA-splicing factor ISY1